MKNTEKTEINKDMEKIIEKLKKAISHSDRFERDQCKLVDVKLNSESNTIFVTYTSPFTTSKQYLQISDIVGSFISYESSFFVSTSRLGILDIFATISFSL